MRDLLFLTEEVLKVTLCFHSKIISYFQKIQEISIWQAKLKDCQSFLDNASQPAPFPLCTAELKEKQLASFECPTIMWLHSWQVWNPARQDSAVNCTLNSSKAELEWVTVICCCRTQDVQRSVGAGGGGVGARGQSQLRTQDAAEGLDVRGSGHMGVCYHRIIAAHLTCGRKKPGRTARRYSLGQETRATCHSSDINYDFSVEQMSTSETLRNMIVMAFWLPPDEPHLQMTS